MSSYRFGFICRVKQEFKSWTLKFKRMGLRKRTCSHRTMGHTSRPSSLLHNAPRLTIWNNFFLTICSQWFYHAFCRWQHLHMKTCSAWAMCWRALKNSEMKWFVRTMQVWTNIFWTRSLRVPFLSVLCSIFVLRGRMAHYDISTHKKWRFLKKSLSQNVQYSLSVQRLDRGSAKKAQ